MEDQIRAELTELSGIDDFRIDWVWLPPWQPGDITASGRDQLRAIGFTIRPAWAHQGGLEGWHADVVAGRGRARRTACAAGACSPIRGSTRERRSTTAN